MKTCTAIVMLSLLAGPAFAEDAQTGTNAAATTKKPAELSSVKKLELADNLAKLGRANKDPLQLIVAAQLLQSAGVKYEARPSNEEGEKGVIAQDKAESVDSLLAEAKSVAKNDKTIVALADDVKGSASKGRVGGGVVSLGQITGNTVHTRTITFRGGSFAEVGMVGIDTSDVWLEIFDQNGNRICRDTDPAYCSFNPIWTGPFTVKVHNSGGDTAHYKLETN